MIQHKKKRYADGDIHTNIVESAFSLLKPGIVGTWHHISAKHLPAYLEEMSFRFNCRTDSDLFQQTLHQLVTTTNLTFERLTAETILDSSRLTPSRLAGQAASTPAR